VNLAQVEASKKQLLQGMALEVRQAYLKSEEAKERIEVSKAAVTQAEEGLRIAEIRYENGVAPSVEILDAQTALTQARTNYVQAMVDYKSAIIELKKAMGTLGR